LTAAQIFYYLKLHFFVHVRGNSPDRNSGSLLVFQKGWCLLVDRRRWHTRLLNNTHWKHLLM